MGLLAPGKSVAHSPVQSSGLYVQEIQLAQEKNQRTLSLHFSQSPDSVRAFSLRSPTRLVIDIRGEVERSASVTHPASDALITRVRVGSHPHHTRFVLDLKAEQPPPFSVEQQAHVVTATLDERDEADNSNANAEQGNTQVLFARVPKASSQSVPPRPAQAPASPAPTVLVKKVTKRASSPLLRRATPPASTPRVTPAREVPVQATPLPAATKEQREATPLKAPPTSIPPLPTPALVSPSPDTPQLPPIVPAPTVLAKKGTKRPPSRPPLRQATPPAPTPSETPARTVPVQITPLPAATKERREATPLKAPLTSVPPLPTPVPASPSPDTPQPPPIVPAPTVLVTKRTPPPPSPLPLRQATPPAPTPPETPAREAPAQATPLPSTTKERREATPLKATPPSVPESLAPAPTLSPQDTPQPPLVSSVPTILAKKVVKEAPPLPLRQVAPPAPTPRETPDREGPAQSTPLPSTPQGLRAAIPLKDAPPAASRLPAPAPGISSPDTSQPPPVPATAAQHLRQGYTLYNQGNIDGAIRQWRKAIDQAPSHAEAHYRIGVALQERGELSQAIIALREATRLNPDEATIHIHLARACEAAGNTQDALAAYRKALQLVPTSAHVHHRIGHVLAAQDDLAGAVQAWRQTIHLQPDYAYAYVSLGRALGQSGQKNEAVAVYEQALQLDPRAPFVAEVRQQIARLRAAEP